jgi:hypothetical protein
VHLVEVLAVIGPLYVLSWYLHPLMRCRKCKGGSRHYGSLHKSKFRFCHKCQGTGRSPRLGARVLMGMGLMKHGPERTGSYGWVRRNRNR